MCVHQDTGPSRLHSCLSNPTTYNKHQTLNSSHCVHSVEAFLLRSLWENPEHGNVSVAKLSHVTYWRYRLDPHCTLCSNTLPVSCPRSPCPGFITYTKSVNLEKVQRVMRDLEASGSRWDVFIKPLPSRLRDLCGREGKKIVKSQKGSIAPWKQCLPDKSGLVHIWTQQDCVSKQRGYILLSQIQSWHWEWKWAQFFKIIHKLSSMICLANEISVFSNNVSVGLYKSI